MKKYVYVIAMFALCVIGMSSANAATVIKVNGEDTDCVDLFAGQTIVAGDVCFAADYDSNTLTIQFNPDVTQGWTLVETQLWLGTNLADMPQANNGNPIPGQFPYKRADGVYVLDLTDLGFACPGPYTPLVAAHAAMARVVDGVTVQTETGWSDGDPFVEQGNWGTYTAIKLTCVDDGGDDPLEDPTDPQPFGTAFAYGDGATCFSEYGFSRWGWTIAIEEEGTYVYDLYAGAGQCDISKGTLVGTLTVEYSGGIVTATYNIMEEYYMEEAHFYAGDAPLPTLKRGKKFVETVAPGQYPYIEDPVSDPNSSSFTVEVDDVDEDGIFIVAHAASDDSLVTP